MITLRWPRVHRPEAVPLLAHVRQPGVIDPQPAGAPPREPAEEQHGEDQHQRHAETRSTSRKVTGRPPSRAMKPSPIRFGGVPTGVAMPPTEAANDVTSIMLIANRRTASGDAVPRSPTWPTIERPIGNSIAVVAVLLIHIEITVATAP